MQSEAVSNELNKNGAESLPITMVDGKIVKSGSYPSNEEFTRLLGITFEDAQPRVTKVKVNKCGCGSSGCC
jgi:hypothetical protein